MTPTWPVFKKGTQFATAVWNDTSGVILPYVTVTGRDRRPDRLPDAETRARTAIQRLLTNSTLFGSQAERTIGVSNIKFYRRLPASDASPMSAGMLATGPANAQATMGRQ